jgi:hypothetical protein
MSMRCVALSLLACLFLGAGSAAADNLADCNFNKVAGNCSAAIEVDPDSHEFHVAATGQCRKVDVQIDGTVYAYSQKDQAIEDVPTVFDKTRQVSIKVSGCTAFLTYDETYDLCQPNIEAAIAPCRAQRQQMNADCAAKGNPAGCWRATQDATQGCYSDAADTANRCMGDRVFELKRTDSAIGIGAIGR